MMQQWSSLSRGAKTAICYMLLLVVMALIADLLAAKSNGWLSAFDSQELSSDSRAFMPPNTKLADGRIHRLGTDHIGRDVLSRIIHGIRPALIVGFLSTLIALVISIILGGLAGYYRNALKLRWLVLIIGYFIFLGVLFQWIYLSDIDELGQTAKPWGLIISYTILGMAILYGAIRFIHLGPFVSIPIDSIVIKLLEVIRSIPGIMLYLVILAIIGKVNIWSLSILIGFLSWSSMTRIARALFIKYREENFVKAIELMGLSSWHTVWHHIFPNMIGPLLAMASLNIGSAILLESSLSFLQVGISSEISSWGSMIAQSRSYFRAWWVVIPPGLLIFSLIFSANLISDSLRKQY